MFSVIVSFCEVLAELSQTCGYTIVNDSYVKQHVFILNYQIKPSIALTA